MAAEAEASREARAKVIAAEGEMKSSRALKEASDIMCESPAALQVCIIKYSAKFCNDHLELIFFFFKFLASLFANSKQHCLREEFHNYFPITN